MKRLIVAALVFGAWCAGHAKGWQAARHVWSAERENYRELLKDDGYGHEGLRP